MDTYLHSLELKYDEFFHRFNSVIEANNQIVDENIDKSNKYDSEIEVLNRKISMVDSQIKSMQINNSIANDELQSAKDQLDATHHQSEMQIKHLRDRNELQKEAEILILKNVKKQKCDFITEQNKLMIESGDLTKNINMEIEHFKKDLE